MQRRTLLLLVTVFAVLTIAVSTYIVHMYITKPHLFIVDPFGKYELAHTDNIIEIIEYRNASFQNLVAKVMPFINGSSRINVTVYSNCTADVTHLVKLCGIAVKELGQVHACINNTCIVFVNESVIDINGSLVPVTKMFTMYNYVLYLTPNGTVLGSGSGNHTYVLYLDYVSKYPIYLITCIDVNITVESLGCNVTLRIS